MLLCPIPKNEAARLAMLHTFQILDTAPEVEFDVTTRVASHLFNAPIALVALMDNDRLWFKSRHGLELEQLDREIAFCAHAIMRPDQLMVVDDLREDRRFASNPLVQQGGPNLRFYAGAPLCTSSGLVMGTIAILDIEPRTFDEKQRGLLRDLSVSVMTAIENRHRSLQLSQLATTDYLTGLANRIQFETALSAGLHLAQRNRLPLSILYMDLDHFKAVNDRFGHGAGDLVLKEVALRLQQQLRAGDTVARLGGDEFAIVMHGGADAVAASALAERIAEAVRPPIKLRANEEVTVGISVGIASCDNGSIDALALIEQADHALYRAKSQATERWSVFTIGPKMSLPTPELVDGDLDDDTAPTERCTACAAGLDQPFPFSMAFQPIVSISGKNVFAYEALVRGLQGETAAEVLGRVTRRNRYAFDQSCRRTAIELAARLGIVETGACLSINFIPGAMYNPVNCVRPTLAAARRAKLPTERLIFEVTEGEEILDPSHLANIFKVYREHGFKPAIDDFGAGYSGLNLLADFQPNIIKLDRKLIQDIDTSLPRRAIVRGVLSVCHDLGITPIAEGVETVEEYRVLRELGIDLFQGYLFARPAFEAFPVPIFPN